MPADHEARGGGGAAVQSGAGPGRRAAEGAADPHHPQGSFRMAERLSDIHFFRLGVAGQGFPGSYFCFGGSRCPTTLFFAFENMVKPQVCERVR